MGFRNGKQHKKGHLSGEKRYVRAKRTRQILIRPRYNKNKFKYWTNGDSLEWFKDEKLEAVFFLDQCMDRLSRKAISENLSPHIKVLQFPKQLSHAYDNTVLRTVMDFVVNNGQLISGKVKIYLFTRDEKFIIDSNSETVFGEYGFEINFLVMRWTLICVREIKEELARTL